MSSIGQIERITQNRVVKLFQNELDYDYLGNWEEREDNSNIEEEILTAWLTKKKYRKNLISKALYEFGKVAGDQSKSLYDVNKEVYSMLRYGVNVQPEIGQNKETVWLIDWEHPSRPRHRPRTPPGRTQPSGSPVCPARAALPARRPRSSSSPGSRR